MSSTPPRVGRAQGASLFWGFASAFFACAASYYFLQNQSNEAQVRKFRGEISTLLEQGQTLEGEKVQLRSVNSDAENLLNAREQVLKEKEIVLTQKELRMDAIAHATAEAQKQVDRQVEVQKNFNVLANKLIKTSASSVVLRPDNRPLLRLPISQLFDPTDPTLSPDGRELLGKLAQALNGSLDKTELRLEVYADGQAEVDKAVAKDKTKPKDKVKALTAWEITTARATALQRFFKEQGSLPNEHIVCVGRGDINPLSAASTPEEHERNRRAEIFLLPLTTPLPPGSITLLPPPVPVSPKHGSSPPTNPPEVTVPTLEPPPDLMPPPDKK